MSRQDRPPLKQAESVQSLIEGLLRQKGMEQKVRAFRTWIVWDKAVGPQIARNARPLRIRDGVLELRVAHPVWMQQLQLMKPQLLKKLNAHLEGASIRDLYFRRGKIAEQPQPDPPTAADTWQEIELCEKDRREIDEAVEAVGDAELRRELKELFTRQRKLDKARENRT